MSAKKITKGPNWQFEAGYSGPVAGIDEVGRGPLAGPVVACAVILREDHIPAGLNDSKKLSEAISKISSDTTSTVALMLHSTMDESLKDLTIGMQRSRYLLELFNENGIPPSRLRIINRGYTLPVSKSNALLNRSVEMKILKKK